MKQDFKTELKTLVFEFGSHMLDSDGIARLTVLIGPEMVKEAEGMSSFFSRNWGVPVNMDEAQTFKPQPSSSLNAMEAVRKQLVIAQRSHPASMPNTQEALQKMFYEAMVAEVEKQIRENRERHAQRFAAAV